MTNSKLGVNILGGFKNKGEPVVAARTLHPNPNTAEGCAKRKEGGGKCGPGEDRGCSAGEGDRGERGVCLFNVYAHRKTTSLS